ncbi:hypothetical protein CDAR_537401 [Caerostris darwini]|uniref:Uncharacterized protein n=1 Tax=Caerostris darwini TaxID=1538125 RepID=A0AAV4P0Q6_9ARAC|nr:hypothetical protein CDAR_537401 [Caerostris darwini]
MLSCEVFLESKIGLDLSLEFLTSYFSIPLLWRNKDFLPLRELNLLEVGMGHESGGSDKGLELGLECDAGGRDFEVLPEATERKDSLENSCVGSSEFLDDISVCVS